MVADLMLLNYPAVFRAYHNKSVNVVIHEWLDYSPEDADLLIQTILDQIYGIFLSTGASKVLVLANKAKGAFSPELQDFIRDIQFPRFAADTNLRFVATVLPHENRIESTYTYLWKEQLARNERFIQADFGSFDEAMGWLMHQS